MAEFYEKNRKTIIIFAAVVLFAFLLWFIFYLPGRQNNYRSDVSGINESIKQTNRDLGTAQDKLDKVERGLDESTERIDSVQKTITDEQSRNTRNQDLIKEGIGTTNRIRKILQELPSANGKESKSSN